MKALKTGFFAALLVLVPSYAQPEPTQSNMPDLTAVLDSVSSHLPAAELEKWNTLKKKLAAKEAEIHAFLKESYAAADGAVKTVEEQYAADFAEAQKKWEDKNLGEAEKKEIQTKLKVAKETLDTVRTQALTKKIEKFQEAQKLILDAQEKQTYANVSTLATTMQLLIGDAKKMRWNDDFAQLGSHINNQAFKLNALERAFDNKVMGQYLQAKLQRVLNSDALCKATQECSKAAKDRVPQSLSPLFLDETGKPHTPSKREGNPEDSHK